MEIHDNIIPSGNERTPERETSGAAQAQAAQMPQHSETGDGSAANVAPRADDMPESIKMQEAPHGPGHAAVQKAPSTDWVWGATGAFFGLLTGWYVTGSVLWALIGAFIGMLSGAGFLAKLVKGRHY